MSFVKRCENRRCENFVFNLLEICLFVSEMTLHSVPWIEYDIKGCQVNLISILRASHAGGPNLARPSSLRPLRGLRVGLRQRCAVRVKPASRAQSVRGHVAPLRFAPARRTLSGWYLIAITICLLEKSK